MSQPLRSESNSKRIRTLVATLLACGVLLGLWQFGKWVGNRGNETISTCVLSGSMAPALHGPARQVQCEECGRVFLCDATAFDSADAILDESICCPNCGLQSKLLAENVQRVNQTVDVIPISSGEKIRRYDVVAFKTTSGEPHSNDKRHSNDQYSNDQYSVKRVLGLPGETIRIRNGDVFINDKLLRKNLAELRRLAIPVHEHTAFANNTATRWRTGSASRWAPHKDGFIWQYAENDTEDDVTESVDWLQYRHSPALPLPFQRGTEGAIKDGYGFNQRLSRSLNDVSDFFLRCEVAPGDCDAIWLKLNHGANSYTCRVTPNDATLVLAADAVADPLEFPMPEMPPGKSSTSETELRFVEFVWGFWDGQIVLSADGKEVFRHAVNDASGEQRFTGDAQPLAIGIAPAAEPTNSTIAIRAIAVYRDIHYGHPLESAPQDEEWVSPPLGQDDYLLLGDNSPISMDSRHNSELGRQLRKRLVGRVVNPQTVKEK